jgi:dimethylhistidine N-methyltransferase
MATASSARALPREAARSGPAAEILTGLMSTPKRLSPKYFYDEAGCRLFERITQQPEYYVTRTEIAVLEQHAAAITQLFPEGAALVEFGMGASTKARILLKAATGLSAFVPVDIAEAHLRKEAEGIARDFPALEVLPVATDFTKPFELPAAVQGRPRVGFFPGSTIGNFEPHEASLFLERVGRILGDQALLIVGVDLVKDAQILNAAYNDSAGVTADFNRNVLVRINRELGGQFDPASFEHHAIYNSHKHRVEMHLGSVKRQKVRVDGETIDFRAGETIHTESSYKYSIDSFRALARGAGWKPLTVWTDERKYFAVHALKLEDKPVRPE